MIKIISSFTEVELKDESKILVLCDIDNTILHYPNCDEFCEILVRDFCPNGKDDPNYEKELQDLKRTYISLNAPSHTDYDGFVSMVKKISDKNGKLMFLTARSSESDDWTKKHLKQIGINPDDFKIHYAGIRMTKGEYIRRYIKLENWEQIIFIDDYESFIKSVLELHPEIECYQFSIQS